MSVGHVYFVQAAAPLGPVKIGYTRDVAKRLEQLRTGHHQELTLLWSMESDNPQEYERKFHRMFSDLRLRGEWFRWHQDIAETIEILRRLEKDLTGASLSARFELVRIPGGGVRSAPDGKGEAAANLLHKFTPTIAIFRNPDPPQILRLNPIAAELCRLVDRRDGVVVVDCKTQEIWRGRRGRDLITPQSKLLNVKVDRAATVRVGPDTGEVDFSIKHCLECGVELTGDIRRTRNLGGDGIAQVRLHFCEVHPSGEWR